MVEFVELVEFGMEIAYWHFVLKEDTAIV